MKNTSILSIVIFSILSLSFYQSYSQKDDTKSKFWQNVRFGGNIGANFNNNFTSIIIAPQAIYQLNDNIGLGAGLNYSYSERDLGQFDDFKSTIVGGSLIALAQPIDYLQISADFEYLNVNRNFSDSSFDDNYWVPALFLGAGYRQGNFVIGARFDVLFDDLEYFFKHVCVCVCVCVYKNNINHCLNLNCILIHSRFIKPRMIPCCK